jgi:hypothetical protein
MSEHSDLENCDRSNQSESIESMPPNPKHSGFVSAIGDLPTPPFGIHPDLEGILTLSGKREIIGYEGYLKELARKLRQNMTLGEVLLWQRLKRKQMRGYDFDRQRPFA